MLLRIFLSVLFVASASAQAVTPMQKCMIQELETTKNQFAFHYAPAEWKKEFLGWDLEDSFQKAKNTILAQSTISDKDFQKIFREFLKSTRDYHVGTQFYSTELAFFPLTVKGANGRYFISSLEPTLDLGLIEILLLSIEEIDEKEVDAENFEKIKIGDEVVAINGQPTKDVIESLIDEELSGDRSPTGYAIAERVLFQRYASHGHTVPKGTLSLTILPKEGDPYTFTFPWIYASESIQKHVYENIPSTPANIAMNLKKKKISTAEFKDILAKALHKDYSVHLFKDLIKVKNIKYSKRISEISPDDFQPEDSPEQNQEEVDKTDLDMRKKGFLPPIGNIVWESDIDKSIYGYLAENASGKRVGYIYLDSFMYGSSEADCMMEQIIDLIARFNEEADTVVFDITNNPGGSAFFMYGVLSTLSDAPMAVPLNKEMLIQEDVYGQILLAKIVDIFLSDEETLQTDPPATLHGYVITKDLIEQIKNYSKTITDTWNSGKTMTDYIALGGVASVMPHPKMQCKKPLIVLTNELDGSAGDFFPAILQDSGRATIFGQKTAGAGGCVTGNMVTSQFGIQFLSMTRSFALRTNGKPIENLGVTPDVPYQITVRDLQENYADYIDSLNATIDKLVK